MGSSTGSGGGAGGTGMDFGGVGGDGGAGGATAIFGEGSGCRVVSSARADAIERTRRWTASTRFKVPPRLARIRTKSKRSVQTAPLRCVIGPDPLILGSRSDFSIRAGILIRPSSTEHYNRHFGPTSYKKTNSPTMRIPDLPC